MCFDPVTMSLMVGGQAGSSAMNKRGQDKVDAERNRVSLEEDQRQRRFQAESDVKNTETLAKMDRGTQDANTQAELAAREQAIDAGAAPEYTAGESSGKVVESNLARRIADAMGEGRGTAKAEAKLGAQGATQQRNNITLGRNALDQRQIGGFSRGSAGVLPYELEEANQKGARDRQIADLFRMGGNLAGMYGMTRTPNQMTVNSTMPSDSGMVYNTPVYR